MRIYRIPATYSSELEARISRAVDEIKIDAFRRSQGDPPLIPDMALDPHVPADAMVAIETVVVVATPSDPLHEVVRRVTEQVHQRRPKRSA